MPQPLSDLPPDLGSALRHALDQACFPLFDGTPNGPGLWRSIERTATAALARMQADGRFVGYDTNAPKGVWVIESVDGAPVDRACDAWPHVSGAPPLISFDRRR